jgi:hypothetical protein
MRNGNNDEFLPVTGCELCAREAPLTGHHLIPRTLHTRKWFARNFTREQLQTKAQLCSDCHDAIHRFIPEKLLGTDFNTVEKLRAHEKVANFVAWVAKRGGTHKTHLPPWNRRG